MNRQQRTITPELLEIARHQVEQQEEIDEMRKWVEMTKGVVEGFRTDLLSRTMRLHALEIQMRQAQKDVLLATTTLNNVLFGLLPTRDARVDHTLHVLFARLQSAEEALDTLEQCKGTP